MGEAHKNHISILVNNVATSFEDFNKLDVHEMTKQTNNKIDNHTFITEVIMKNVRDKGLKQFTGSKTYRSAVINVGTQKTSLVESKTAFKNKSEESEYDVYRATSIY